MTENVTYTPEEVARILKISKGTVYELIKRGELPAFRVGKKVRISAADLEHFTHLSLAGGTLPPPFSPGFPPEKKPTEQNTLILCGQDIILDVIARHMERQNPTVRVFRSYMGSLDGLMALYKNQVHVVTTHLLDGETGEYNVPYIRRFLPGQRAIVINLVYRSQGFYVAPGNPKKIRGWEDLLKPDVTFVNREKGSGTRVLLDEKLRQMGCDGRQIKGYYVEETSHIAVASAVARGTADVGLGIEKAALQVPGVTFIPLANERYDLVMYKRDLEENPLFQTLLAVIQSKEFHDEVKGLGGYDLSQTGKVVGEV